MAAESAAQTLINAAVAACVADGLDVNVAVVQAFAKLAPSGGPRDPNQGV